MNEFLISNYCLFLALLLLFVILSAIGANTSNGDYGVYGLTILVYTVYYIKVPIIEKIMFLYTGGDGKIILFWRCRATLLLW